MAIFAIFLARFLDVTALATGIAAFIVRRSSVARKAIVGAAVAVAASALSNILNCSMQLTCRSPFGPDEFPIFVIGVVACAAQYAVFGLIVWRRRAKTAP